MCASKPAKLVPIDSAKASLSACAVGRNSCNGGSSKRTVIGRSCSRANISWKSWRCISNSSARYFLRSSSVRERIIWRTAGIRSLWKNMCSVRQSPTPSAPRDKACLTSVGESALALTCSTFISLTQSMKVLNLPPKVGFCLATLPA